MRCLPSLYIVGLEKIPNLIDGILHVSHRSSDSRIKVEKRELQSKLCEESKFSSS